MTKSKNFFQNLLKPFKSSSTRDQHEEDLEEIAAKEQKNFSFEALVAATKNFHVSHKLGEGGFGQVFQGKLSDGRDIAVKRLSQRSAQGKPEFLNEAKLLSRVQHKNVVNLLGYCVRDPEKLLVYEYVSNQSLDKFLFTLESNKRELLDWKRRHDIVTGVAKGLLYLHEQAHCTIIHRDIKASNILLDDKWVPKIADFGMARLFPEDQTHVQTRVAGTIGYMAPEYLMHGNLSKKADVFSFGVVVLELISGQNNSSFDRDPDSGNLIEWAYNLYRKQRSLEIMDPVLVSPADTEQISMLVQIGLLCVQSDPQLRPAMDRVVVLLSRRPSHLEEPTGPGYRRYRTTTTLSVTGNSDVSSSELFGSTKIQTARSTATATTSSLAILRSDRHGKRPIIEYETKEKIKTLRRSKGRRWFLQPSRSGFSSASCSNAEDSDGLSIDLNQEAKEEDGFYSHQEYELDLVFEVEREKESVEEEKPILMMKDKSVQVCVEEDVQPEIPPQHLEFFLDFSGHTLVPIELIDSTNDEHRVKENDGIEIEGDDDEENKDQDFVIESEVVAEEREALVFESGSRVEKVDAFLDVDINEEPTYSMLDAMEMEEDENSLVFHAKDSHSTTTMEQFEAFPLARWPSLEASEAQEMDGALVEEHSDDRADDVACEEVAQANNENEADVSIGTEIPDLDITDEIQIEDSVHMYECTREDPPTSSANLYAVDDHDHGPAKVEEQMVELQSLSVQDREHERDNEASFQLEVNEIEEDKCPDTPTSVDSLNQLHKKLLMLEKRDSGTEESLDGSVTSELEGSDGVVTVERLKAVLRSERKTLQVLYSELEEERSASAVAANQTMAMINRLQEEKAAMQMEALQYQRMMEEQSEYEQEALQLLNELMVKREKEKQELEKELDGYRKKLLEYVTKEKIKTLRRSEDGSTRSGFSSASCSNAEDSDGLSIDLNQEEKEEDGFYSHQEFGNQNTAVDTVVYFEQSLADFEEERMSILKLLKVLEEKLLTLDDEDGKEQHFENIESIDNFHEENDDHVGENGHLNGGETNGHANGFPKELMMNGKHHPSRRIAGQKGKSLLPLFDAICDENGDAFLNGNGLGNGVHDSYESKFKMDSKKLAIEEEVDHLYERLQALEADREFLKHCISSLKKGVKGMDLVQEILQYLRDLRNEELRVRNLGDNAII